MGENLSIINHKNILKKKFENIFAIINNIYFLVVKKNTNIGEISFFTENIITENIIIKNNTNNPLIIIKKYIDINPYKRVFFINAYSIQ